MKYWEIDCSTDLLSLTGQWMMVSFSDTTDMLSLTGQWMMVVFYATMFPLFGK
jgi:hypothetical protein